MKLFHKKPIEIIKEKTTTEKLVEYIEKCINGGKDIGYAAGELKSKGWSEKDVELAINTLNNNKKIKEQEKLDLDVERRIKKYPKNVRGHLRRLYEDYKNGKIIFPEGFDKNKFLGEK